MSINIIRPLHKIYHSRKYDITKSDIIELTALFLNYLDIKYTYYDLQSFKDFNIYDYSSLEEYYKAQNPVLINDLSLHAILNHEILGLFCRGEEILSESCQLTLLPPDSHQLKLNPGIISDPLCNHGKDITHNEMAIHTKINSILSKIREPNYSPSF